jgi:hypothetical protein
MHDCDHDHRHSEFQDHDTDSDSDQDDDCLVCELDMETGTIVTIPQFNFSPNMVLKPVLQHTESLPLPSFNLYDHRGPPASC